MRLMERKRKDICIIVNQSRAAGRGLLRGIFRFAETRPEWRTHLYEPDEHGFGETTNALQDGTTDGIITSELENPDFAAKLEGSSVPLVVVGTRQLCLHRRAANLGVVNFDEEKIGSFAAQQLLYMGQFKSFGYVGCTDAKRAYLSRLRHHGFAKELRRHGLACAKYREGTGLPAWLLRLPKPAAIVGCVDDRAADILGVCDRINIAVPGSISVLGIDNSATICQSAHPTLSSIATDFTEEGFAAAAELDRIMSCRSGVCGRRNYTSRTDCSLVRRDSTRVISSGLQLVNRAIDYIQRTCDSALTIEMVARHLRVSSRLLHLRFREFSDKSLHELIVAGRIENLKSKLVASRQNIAEVTAACGFTNPTHIKTLFKKRTGCTLSAWRRQHETKHTP